MLNLILFSICYVLINVLPLIVSIAFFTLLERKIIAAVQRRRGPNTVGIFGLLQPIADGIKLITTEQFMPRNSKNFVFLISPSLVFFFSLLYWCFLPNAFGSIADPEYGLLVVQVISSLSVYGVFLAGLTSSSKYAVLGTLRAVSQFISYEICAGICILFVALMGQSLSIIDIVNMQKYCGPLIFVGWLFFIGYYICILAETNRTPFDLAEAEAELVAGFHTEYSATGFALFFLGEYCNLLVFGTLLSLLFLSGWNFLGCVHTNLLFNNMILAFKTVLICSSFIVVRAYEPRLRFDQILEMCWKILMPLLFGIFFLFCESFVFFDVWKYLVVYVAYVAAGMDMLLDAGKLGAKFKLEKLKSKAKPKKK